MKLMVFSILTAFITSGLSFAATSRKMVDEMEDYVRDLIRAHPEVAGDKKKKEARADMVKEAGQNRVFEVTEAEEKKLRRRKDMMKDGEYKAALENIKSLNSKDPKITFLIKYAEEKNIKGVEKFLAYRLIKFNYASAAQKVSHEREKRMATILKLYVDYKAANSKPPASLEDLKLPEDCKKFVDSKGNKIDWIYIGHLGPRLKANNSHVVLIEPEPLGDIRVCGMDTGEVVRFQNSSVEAPIKKLVDAMDKGDVKPAGVESGSSAASPALSAIMKKIALYKDLNNNKMPGSLNDLTIDEKHKVYKDPVSGEETPWIYLGVKSRIQVNKELKVIIVAPKAHNGKRLAGLSDGKIVALNDKQIAPLLK
ncbi:MAG: hypothetical protein AB8F34_11695 [Akkermansiaceae bacterium]